ncbi:glycosyltransferase family 15 protein [Xylariales sp. AK1849]|nr:glycosyltransferase family 15 protein [Xylariales sp. AK1849]
MAICIVGLLWVYELVPVRIQEHPCCPKSTTAILPNADGYSPPIAQLSVGSYVTKNGSPIDWLRQNTYDQPTHTLSHSRIEALIANRPRAAFLALVRNAEQDGMVNSILQVEARFNSRKTHRYDWIFFNDEPFTESFMSAVSNATGSLAHFEVIKPEHWVLPDWIDKSRYEVARHYLGGIGVGKAWMGSYHQMCRWNAGLFALEVRLQNYDWYWRVEPNIHYTCNINYDVFRFMRDNDMAYGFNMAILDDARSFPSLWERTQTFKRYNRDKVHPEADMRWLLHQTDEPDRIIRSGTGFMAETIGDQYNNCQFYSNFEVASLKFFRGKEHQSYFRHLDKSGGFFYERYGDAPVHTLSVSMLLPKRRVWFFRDIGYSHGLCENCPPHVSELPMSFESNAKYVQIAELSASMKKAHHELAVVGETIQQRRSNPGLQCGCTTQALDNGFSSNVPYESKQIKPIDTCIRQWLGGNWLVKKFGWSREQEIRAGGDGYGGYLLTGLESNPYADGTLADVAIDEQARKLLPGDQQDRRPQVKTSDPSEDSIAPVQVEADITPIQM